MQQHAKAVSMVFNFELHLLGFKFFWRFAVGTSTDELEFLNGLLKFVLFVK
jgi:hypothetical protein